MIGRDNWVSMVGPVGRHLTTQDECASITRQITRNVYITTCRKIMQSRVFHPPSFFLPFLLLLCSEPHYCQSEQSRWGIESDINRLLSNDDATLYHHGKIEQSAFNGTAFANSTSNENFTSYWHLPADAPLLEQPAADTSQSPIPIKRSHDFRRKAGPPLRSCTRLQVLPLRPLYEFIAFVCGGLLFGSLSSIWLTLLCNKCWRNRTQPQRGAFAVKCSLILGLNIHATACSLAFLLLQATSRGTVSFVNLSPHQMSNFCNIAISMLDICTSVFWLFVGFINTLLIMFLRILNPGVNRREPWSSLFKSQRNSVFLSFLAHCVPWVCGIALNTLQLIFLQETPTEIKLPHSRSQLMRALTSVLPVLFAVITIGTRIWKFQGHRLHLPSLSRVVPSYACQHEYSKVRSSPTDSTQSAANSPISNGAGPTAVALFSSTIVTGFQLICSLLAAFAICLWIISISFNEPRVLSRIHSIVMYFAICLFYAVSLTGYSNRLTLASAITTRNSYIPGEIARDSEGYICAARMDSKLSPRELLEIPKFTRTQFFDTSSELPEREQTDQCITSKAVQIIAVYEPIVS